MSSFVNLLEVIYPVGSVYYSFSSTSPATLFGGTWDSISGSFLYPSTTANKTGGSSKHNHYWFINTLMYYGLPVEWKNNQNDSIFDFHDLSSKSNSRLMGGWEDTVPNYNVSRISGDTNFTHNKNYGIAGTRNTCDSPAWYCYENLTTDASTLPPYITCYCWKRTA